MRSRHSSFVHPFLPVALVTLVLLLAWDATGGDLWAARLFGTPFGFPLRQNWWLTAVVHQGGKNLSWVLVIVLLLAVWWPVGVLSRLSRGERWQLVIATLLSVGAITLLKHANHTSCPWDVQAFGGVATYVSHWDWSARDGGPGGCFPAGHASAAFAFLGGWFVLRRRAPRAAAVWLTITLLAGAIFGLGQQMRGAHYPSHTLWTAWICWVVGGAVDALAQAWGARRTARRSDGARSRVSLNES
ncbi:PAP2 family protein [Xenophilus aerolatus]|nr:PAP2 family protein [Xenophilus aerolatus]